MHVAGAFLAVVVGLYFISRAPAFFAKVAGAFILAAVALFLVLYAAFPPNRVGPPPEPLVFRAVPR